MVGESRDQAPREVEPQEVQVARTLSEALSRALRVARVFNSTAHPSARSAVEGLTAALGRSLERVDPLQLDVRPSRLFYAGIEVHAAAQGVTEDVLNGLFASGVRSFRWKRGIGEAEVARFVEVLATSDLDAPVGEDVVTRLWDLDLGHVDFEIVEDLLEVEESSSVGLPPAVGTAIDAVESMVEEAAIAEARPPGAAALRPGPPPPFDVSALALVAEQADTPEEDEGAEAAVVRAGEILLDALARGKTLDAKDAAWTLGALLAEHVRRHDGQRLQSHVDALRSLSHGDGLAHDVAALVLDMLVPGGPLEVVLYELLRAGLVTDEAMFDDLASKTAASAPEALARLWAVVASPDQRERLRDHLRAAVARDRACLSPLLAGDLGGEVASQAVDLLFEAAAGPLLEGVLVAVAEDERSSDSARTRARARACELKGESWLTPLVAALREGTREQRLAALGELERSGVGSDGVRTALEAFFQDRAFQRLDQEQMDAVARTYATVADLRALRALNQLVDTRKRITLTVFRGAGKTADAAEKALAFLKEKRRGQGVQTARSEALDGFDRFARALLRDLGRRRRDAGKGEP